MSRLEELINELCPDGVEYIRVGDYCEVLTGGEAPIESKKILEPEGEYIYPIYSNGVGKNALWGYSKSYRVGKEAITFSSIGTIGFPTLREPFFTPIIRLKVITPLNPYVLDIRFLKYVLETVEIIKQKSSVPNVNSTMIKELQIPLPPLEVQREIVKILDNFTELKAELTARKKQYEYYRDELLTFGDEVSKVKIKDAYSRIKGTPITARKMKEIANEEGNIRIFAGGRTVVNAFEKDIPKANITRIPAVLVQSRGIIDFIYYDNPFTFKNEMWAYTSENEYSIKYLKYYLDNNINYFRDAASGMGSMPQISLIITENYLIPFPSLNKQKQIVNILDKFDSLTNSLSQGLPAEIEARQKQYDYYRDKLLTFREKK